MSLLMDALKRAEETKQDAARQMTNGGRPAPGNLALEPLGAPPQTLPELGPHIDALDADLAATAGRPAPTAAPPRPAFADDANREAVRNAFAAKTSPAPSRQPMWIALGILVVAAAGIGAYVWYELNHLGGSLARPAPAAPPPPAATAPAPPAPSVLPAALPAAASPPAQAIPAAPAAFAPATRTSGTPAAAPHHPADNAAERAPPGVRLVKTRPEPDANVSRGYQNLQGNALEAARRDYEKALQADPRNVDALLGLAAIAQKQGRGGDADRLHQTALEADPKDATALAAVIGGNAAVDPTAAESRLKTLLAAQPESAALNFALGNLYARQGRWADAQPAYFNAVAADGDNPDYLMNLAVSLDHLRQPRLAAQHYRLALEAAEKRPPAFERERIRKRLQELQP